MSETLCKLIGNTPILFVVAICIMNVVTGVCVAVDAARHSVQIEGTVISTAVRAGRGACRGGCTIYSPRIQFEYKVNQMTFEQEDFLTSSHIRAEACSVLSRFQPGTRLVVHVDPAAPEKAFIRNPGDGIVGGIGWALLCLAMGLFFSASFLSDIPRMLGAWTTRTAGGF